MPETATAPITSETTMTELLIRMPGAQRALFARYHIGGCRSCGFQPGESLGEVCARNENLSVDEVIEFLLENHASDEKILLPPEELHSLLAQSPKPALVDIRTEEEFEAVHIGGARRFTQDLLNEIFASWPKDKPIIVYDHTGERSLDAAAYLIGHGFANVHCLQGGIDAYSREADPSLPRYQVALETAPES